MVYVSNFRHGQRVVEAEQLVTKLAAGSRHVHGPEHSCTLLADTLVKQYKEHCVIVLLRRNISRHIDMKMMD